MALIVGGSVTFDVDPSGGAYLDVDLHVQLDGLLTLDLSVGFQPGGFFLSDTVAGPLGGLIPSLTGGLLGLLPPGGGAVVGGPFVPEVDPPSGSTSIIDLGGTLIDLPSLFV